MGKQVNDNSDKKSTTIITGMISGNVCISGSIKQIGLADIFHDNADIYKRVDVDHPWEKVSVAESFELLAHFHSYQSDYAFGSIEL